MINNRKIIGVCLSKIQDEFGTDYISNLHRFALDNDYKLIIFNSLRDLYFGDLNDQGSKKIFDTINYDILDAIVILCESIYDKQLKEDIIAKAGKFGVPVILVHGDHEGCCCIHPDYSSAYKQVIEHMINDHGSKSFLFIGGRRNDDPETELRLKIVKDTLAKHDLDLPEENVMYGEYWDIPARMAVQDYLRSGRALPDTILCANDNMAMAVCEELSSNGYIVPSDIKVTGFDGLVSAEYFMPRLTTCKEDIPYLAELTIRLINGSLNGTVQPGAFSETYMAYIGESCGCVNGMAIDFRRRASFLYKMTQEIQQHEKHIYSLADQILDCENLNMLGSVLRNYILPNSGVCLNEDFIMASLGKTGDKQTEQAMNELIVVTSRAEDYKNGRQGRFPVSEMVPDLEAWLNDDTLYILTPIYMNAETCGYYAVKTNDIPNTTHKVFRVSKIMNIAFGALINRLYKQRIQNSMQNAMFIDPLSGLANLKGLAKWFTEFSDVEENHKKTVTVSVYHIPQYKYIYENFGIEEIETSIRFVADALSLANKDNGFIARSGTDEFVVINYVDDENEVSMLIDNAVAVFYGVIEGYNSSNEKGYAIEVNCGCTTANSGWNSSLSSLIKLANAEMYMTKVKNGLTAAVKEDKPAAAEKNVKDMYNEFMILVEKNLFTYYFQPIIDAKTGDIYAYEALMRSAGGIKMSPMEILDVAKEYNMLYNIERATLFNVMERYAKDNEMFRGAKVFINTIPGNFLKNEDLVELKTKYSQYMRNFVFEITEQGTVSDAELDSIRYLGSISDDDDDSDTQNRIAVDDYGTGHSNIVNLLRYSPHIIKIDRFLISNIQNDQNKQMFVKSTIEFARINNIKVLAEGVETYEEMKKVIEFGVDLIQGFYTARPAPDPIGELPIDIRNEIINENIIVSRYGSDLMHYIVNGDATIDLYELALQKYGSIIICKGNVRIIGKMDSAVELPIIIEDDTDISLTFRDVCLRSAEKPAVRLGKNSRTVLTLEGKNTILKNGISVPENSSLEFRGDGSLKVSLKTNGGAGIGSGYDGTYGNITFAQTGNVTVELFIDKGVGIGGGAPGENTALKFLNGTTTINSQCVESLGIGSVRGKSVIEIGETGSIVSHCSGKSAVALGSIDGDTVVNNCGKLELQADGELCASLGVLNKGTAEVNITGGYTSAVVHGDTAVCIGSLHGYGDITCSAGKVIAYGEGDTVSGYGSSDGSGVTRISGGTVTVKILSGNIKQFGSADCRTVITGGNVIPAQKDQISAVNIFDQPLHCEKLTNDVRYERTFYSDNDKYTYFAERDSTEEEFCVYIP
ncbi:MAG: EAL domain-containing protein [Ruminiclostridium sp.]|nr:EAL domain-containing protein [Ruminiclostridium sp.]